MCKHEEKQCPRCRVLFECKPGTITQCQCFGISFTPAEKIQVEEAYADCLCRNCLIEMKNEFAKGPKQLTLQKTIDA